MGGMPRPDASAKLAATAPRRSRSGLAIIIAAVVFVAVVVAVVIGATTSSKSSGGGGTAFPKGAASLGAPMVVNPEAPASVPVLDVFEDPQCPACATMDKVYGAAIAELAC